MRVLIFHPALAPYQIALYNALAERVDLKVVFLRENLLSQKFNQDRLKSRLTCNFDYLLRGFEIGSRPIRFGIGKVVSEFEPDVVIGYEYSPVSLYLALLKGIGIIRKSVAWTDDNVTMCNAIGIARKTARRFVLGQSDGLIVHSEPVRDWFRSVFRYRRPIGVCPIIQDQNVFRQALRDVTPFAASLAAKMGLGEKKILLSVGRLVDIKGFDRVIHAFASVAPAFPEAVLVIVGDGPEKRALVDLVEKIGIPNGRIRFMGRLEGRDLMVWYYIGHAFVLASHAESYGAVVNEALMAGMPVICSMVAGASHLIQEGKNGYTFEPKDSMRLEELMRAVLSKIIVSGAMHEMMRRNLMPIVFDDAVNGFLAALG